MLRQLLLTDVALCAAGDTYDGERFKGHARPAFWPAGSAWVAGQ